MIDWHSHVLPNVDDGSRDVSESLIMLKTLKEQGVDLVIATPHFFADDESVDDFLEKRERAWKELSREISENVDLSILLGAEVKYYSGISRMSGLERLQIGNSGLLLLEMPMSRWTEYTVRELAEINSSRGLTVIMAHIERYFKLQSKDTWRRLRASGILMQVNATAFEGMGQSRRTIKLLKSGMMHFVGSDCHNMTSRPPKIQNAYETLEKKCGEHMLSQIDEYGYNLLSNC